MCTVCGCNDTRTNTGSTQSHSHGHDHDHDHGHHHSHSHDHDSDSHHHSGPHHYGNNDVGLSVPGRTTIELIEIERDILSKNDSYAEMNRQRFQELGALALNLVSSPGAGKTTLLEKTVSFLKGQMPIGVVEGDQQTSNDADRIRALGVPAVQVNTGRGCHLDAHMVGHAIDDLHLERDSVVFIENVGNLVCPASFDLGEACKVVILSVTEGDDKPLKYPDMFAAADIMILSKIDLLPYVPFDAAAAIEHARNINPNLTVIEVSALTAAGMDDWFTHIETMRLTAGERSKPSELPNPERMGETVSDA